MRTETPGPRKSGVRRLASLPLAALGVFSAEKSFRLNPVIGSPWLNAHGLHRRRVAVAAALTARRRAALASRLDPNERAALERDGIVVRHDVLSPDVLARIRTHLDSVPLPAWQMRQGETVTRVMPLPVRENDGPLGALATLVRQPDVRDLVGYAAGRSGHIVAMLQTVAVEPGAGAPDPQAMLHADTFHPSAKLWLFLHDVGEEDGPFAYAPGSHRLTAERLAWEHERSVAAATNPDRHHAAGSFRLPEAELPTLGYGPCRTYPVPANTLVVADTFGFHRRAPSTRPTIRLALYGILRRNPFLPWNGLDPLDLPVLRRRSMRTHLALQDRRARRGRPIVYENAGLVLAGAPPSVEPPSAPRPPLSGAPPSADATRPSG